MTKLLQFEVAGHSDVGAVRQANEDSIDWFLSPSKEVALAIVADGMGGHAGGAKASQTAVEVFVATLAPSLAGKKFLSAEMVEQGMFQAGEEAHHAIHDAKLENPDYMKMGTTIVSIWLQENFASLLHVGDSRCYRLRCHSEEVEMVQLTRDDSVVQTMVEEGTLDVAEAEISPYRNMLTQAIGSDGEILLNQTEIEVQAGDLYLLCSDGLYNELSKPMMVKLLKEHGVFNPDLVSKFSLEAASKALVDAAVLAGGHDNTSLILVSANRTRYSR